MPRQDIRSGYAYTDDGVQIHWRVLGSGIPLVCSNGVGVGTFFWKYIAERYQHEYSVVLWDYRGHGLSARTIDPYNVDLSIQRHAMDLNCVLNAAFQENPEEIILMGHSMGCQVSLEAYQILGPRVKCLGLPRRERVCSCIVRERRTHDASPPDPSVPAPLSLR